MGRWSVLLCLCLLSSANTYAGVKEGRITSILVATNAPDRAFIKVDAAYTQAEPSCSVGVSQWDFIVDITTVTGKALYSLALAAQVAGTTVTVGGFGTCTLRANYEDLEYIHTNT